MKPVVHVTRDTEYGYRITCTKIGLRDYRVHHVGGLAGAFCEEILDLNAQLQFRDEQLQKLRNEAEELRLFVAEMQQLREEVEKLHQEKNTAPDMAHGARIPRASLAHSQIDAECPYSFTPQREPILEGVKVRHSWPGQVDLLLSPGEKVVLKSIKPRVRVLPAHQRFRVTNTWMLKNNTLPGTRGTVIAVDTHDSSRLWVEFDERGGSWCQKYELRYGDEH